MIICPLQEKDTYVHYVGSRGEIDFDMVGARVIFRTPSESYAKVI